MAHRALVVYATEHGHTGRIAERIAAVLRRAGVETALVELPKGRRHPHAPSPTDQDAVVVAGSLHAGRHQRRLVNWIRSHAAALANVRSALVSVSLTAADDSDEARAATRACVDDLIDDTGWTPDHVRCVAGALQYREYDLPTRVLMRLIARHHHQSTDVHEDVDYTDWSAVEAFAEQLAAELDAVPAAGAPRS